nr:TetR family transcriptional regulator C-terminal domain-containing protein [Streptomyces sp. NBC_00830]
MRWSTTRAPHFAEHAGLHRSLQGPTGSACVIEYVRLRTTAAAHSSGHPAATDHPTPTGAADGPSGLPHDVSTAAFVADALIGVAADWLQRGCPTTPMKMTRSG